MLQAKSFSHHWTGQFLTWRDQQNRSDNAVKKDDITNNTGKKIIGAGALVGLLATSLIEIVAYSALALLSLALYPCTDRPYNFSTELLCSTIFAVSWVSGRVFSLKF